MLFVGGLLKVLFSVYFCRKTFSFDLNVKLSVKAAFKSCWHGIVSPQIRQFFIILNVSLMCGIFGS